MFLKYSLIYILDPDHWPVKSSNVIKAVLLARDSDLKEEENSKEPKPKPVKEPEPAVTPKIKPADKRD